ncbi:MAG: asparagine--tRNA ligase [Acidobacteriota bacterium]
MKRVTIETISSAAGVEARIYGWVHNKRSSGKIRFVMVRDGTGILQAVITRPELLELFDRLTHESSVIVEGAVRADARAPGGYEMDVSAMQVVQIAEEFPITPKEHGTAFLMEHRHLWLRSQRQWAILRVRAEIIRACRDYLDSHGFLLVDTPIFTPAACEGTTTLFETQYFDDKAYLTQSGQLYSEATCAAFGKVYCFGPTFRAEKSKTRRHLTEFWMVEPEMAYADLEDNVQLAEEFLYFIVQRVIDNRQKELAVLGRDVEKLRRVKRPFPRMTYTEAVEILKKEGSEIEWGGDFGGNDETILSNKFDSPLIVHRYPSAVKAFYMKPDPDDPALALCVDVLAPEGYGEVIGGGQRLDDGDLLLKRIDEHGLPREAFQWYLDIRRYGSVPHSGFGMGVERATAWLCGIEHIRETIPFPRTLYRIYP